uniref:Uncharacterized protein n=1 Tax=Acartia pacifica TaxID=335913 RepID=A0A0U2TGU9_ACAPC|nr:hypothetical protein [Acartia pacifica]
MDGKQVAVLLKKLDLSLDQWRLQVLTGKRVMTDIIGALYPDDKLVQDSLTEQLDLRLTDLKSALDKMNTIVLDIESLNVKLKAMLDLQSMSGGQSLVVEINQVPTDIRDLATWASSILSELGNQLRMNTAVVTSICHLETRELALFHQGVWTLQPAVTGQTELFMSCIRHIVQQEAAR